MCDVIKVTDRYRRRLVNRAVSGRIGTLLTETNKERCLILLEESLKK